jgi:cytoplasmic iron level regulating protein YaaA (DUF328/UPF0246 family)
MILALSPAKSLNYQQEDIPFSPLTSTRFKTESFLLIKELRNLSRGDLAELMNISTPLADLNYQRFHSWRKSPNRSTVKPAAYAFDGDVYTGLDISTLPSERLEYLQEHVRILSGLYGLLRPMDLMQPYRLEMGTKLKIEEFKNLYEFWGNKITEAINKDMKKLQSEQVVINLASKEYFKSVRTKHLNYPVINIEFKDWKNDAYKVISFFAKKARGRMTREIVQNEISSAETIKQIQFDGYTFNPEFSNESNWTFTRETV